MVSECARASAWASARAAVVAAGLVLAGLHSGGGTAAAGRPVNVSTAATLSLLGGRVEYWPAGGSEPRPAATGSNLAEGDRVLTGPDGRALITFLDGSTIIVEPGSDVQVKRLDVGGDRSSLRVLLRSGTVWARLVSWLGGRGTVSLEANTYTATAHDGLIGAQSRPDGGFVCWTRAGTVELEADGGRHLARLSPGEKVTIGPTGPPVIEVFRVNQSTIEITTSAPVLPLVVMPDGRRVAGFVEPGIEVNQVFGSRTATTQDGTRTVEVPAGVIGTYRLVLVGVADGPFTVRVIGAFRGEPVYRAEARRDIQRGERLGAAIVQWLASSGADPASTGADPRTARVAGGRLQTLRPVTGEPPGTILLSPLELAGAGR
jgi:hypothetical protein